VLLAAKQPLVCARPAVSELCWKAKRQQQDRRGESLFKKACEYSAGCDAEVYLCVKIKRNGQIYFFNSEWRMRTEPDLAHVLRLHTAVAI
jgi:SRF-type transcription factor (DNA-binding and dimerisation domain)